MVTFINSCNEVNPVVNSMTQPNTNNHQHNVKAVVESDGDTYTCKNKEQMRKKLECAKTNGKCGVDLFYTPSKEGWWFLPDQKAVYTYICDGTDTAGSIREMFNLKDGALRKFDTHIFDIHRPYPKGHEIKFYEEDIKEWE